jgi:thymidylate synthase (FAD)
MILIKPSYEILAINGADLLLMEKAGRTCYKSESKGAPAAFLKSKIKAKHLTIIEHGSMTVKFIVDRGFTHELVRHRMAVYSQESTRYCNYSGGVTFIIPPWVNILEGEYDWEECDPAEIADPYTSDFRWFQAMQEAEMSYLDLLGKNWSPQQARTVLPNSLKTEIVMTANFREWRLVFEQRALGLTGKPHPQMSEIMIPLMNEMKDKIPAIFGSLGEEKE